MHYKYAGEWVYGFNTAGRCMWFATTWRPKKKKKTCRCLLLLRIGIENFRRHVRPDRQLFQVSSPLPVINSAWTLLLHSWNLQGDVERREETKRCRSLQYKCGHAEDAVTIIRSIWVTFATGYQALVNRFPDWTGNREVKYALIPY